MHDCDCDCDEYDYGGGLNTSYFDDDELISELEFRGYNVNAKNKNPVVDIELLYSSKLTDTPERFEKALSDFFYKYLGKTP